jgi:hypothetical protein
MKRLLAALTVIASLASLSSAAPEPQDLSLRDLEKLEATWIAQRITRYSFTLERSCFCAPRLISATFVVSGAVSKMQRGSVPSARETMQPFVSIPKILAQMRSKGRVAVVMNSRNTLPVQVILDPLPQAADDEQYLNIKAFQKR